jgi:hypothetical protein
MPATRAGVVSGDRRVDVVPLRDPRCDELPGGNHLEGVPVRLSVAAHRARTDARPTAAAGGDRVTQATPAPRTRRDLAQYCGRFSPRALTLDAPSGPLRGGAEV